MGFVQLMMVQHHNVTTTTARRTILLRRLQLKRIVIAATTTIVVLLTASSVFCGIGIRRSSTCYCYNVFAFTSITITLVPFQRSNRRRHRIVDGTWAAVRPLHSTQQQAPVTAATSMPSVYTINATTIDTSSMNIKATTLTTGAIVTKIDNSNSWMDTVVVAGTEEEEVLLVVIGTDPMTKPKYDAIIGPFGTMIDSICLTLFRNQLREQVIRGMSDTIDSDDNRNDDASKRRQPQPRPRPQVLLRADPMYYGPANYRQIVSLAAALNARYKTQPTMIQQRAQTVLQSLFPTWLPKWYTLLFARPFPQFSARMNAYVTSVLGVWLMGECTINDIVVDTNVGTNNNNNTTFTNMETKTAFGDGKQQGVLVTRCRFLEESQCASICINSCKIPTQNFFAECMGVPLLMEPNYSDGSCQFSFGIHPNTISETTAIQTPCLSRCPTAGSYRRTHQNPRTNNNDSTVNTTITATIPPSINGRDKVDYNATAINSLCSMMGDTTLRIQN